MCSLAAYKGLGALRDQKSVGGFRSHFTIFIVKGSIKYFLVYVFTVLELLVATQTYTDQLFTSSFAVLLMSEILGVGGGVSVLT